LVDFKQDLAGFGKDSCFNDFGRVSENLCDFGWIYMILKTILLILGRIFATFVILGSSRVILLILCRIWVVLNRIWLILQRILLILGRIRMISLVGFLVVFMISDRMLVISGMSFSDFGQDPCDFGEHFGDLGQEFYDFGQYFFMILMVLARFFGFWAGF